MNFTMTTNESYPIGKACPLEVPRNDTLTTGMDIAIPVVTTIFLTLIILLTIVGNILVVLSVFTYKPLRIVQNFFIVSLAVADLTVAVLVLPFNVAYMVLDKWLFGIHVCKMWLTCDILCCTASILNLCAIALDRYWAITDPINYAQQRTLNRVMGMIIGVWVLSALISSPPLLGWNDWPPEEEFNNKTVCQLTRQQGYVIYSSLGSFFIPLFIMTIVYVEIFVATRRRLRERAKASRMNMQVRQNDVPHQQAAVVAKDQVHPCADQDSVSSETNHNEHPHVEEVPSGKNREKKRKNKKKPKNKAVEERVAYLAPMLALDDSITENNDSASGSNHRTSLNHLDDNHTTNTTNTESPRSRTQEVTPPHAEAPPVVVVPVASAAAAAVAAAAAAAKKPTVVYQFIEEKQRISLSKERRAARTLGIIMGVFVVCWLPFFLLYVIEPFCDTCCPSQVLINVITWLGYINSALNPIIYTIFNMDFRRAFKKLLHIKP